MPVQPAADHIRNEFQERADEYKNLWAAYNANYDTVGLWWGTVPAHAAADSQVGQPEGERAAVIFEALCRRANEIFRVGDSNGKDSAHQVWLKFMARRGWPFEYQGQAYSISRAMWHAGVKDGKSPAEVRRSLLQTIEVHIAKRHAHCTPEECMMRRDNIYRRLIRTPHSIRRSWRCRNVFTAAADFCLTLDVPYSGTAEAEAPAKTYKTVFGRNVDQLRKECGWSFDEMAQRTGVDRSLTLGHINQGKGARRKTAEEYAQAFSEKLGREVTVAELKR